jgi:exonuclease SbcD
MKVVILGDTHFGGGYSLGKTDAHRHVNTRLIDFSNTFDYVIDYIIANDVSHLIITGDIFEYRRPQASELSLFSKKIRKLIEFGIHTHIVVGNHDMIREQKATTIDVLRSLKLPTVHVYPDIESIVCGEDDLINFIFFPFRTRQMLDCLTNEDAAKRLSDRLEYEINGLDSGPIILVGHLMLQGTQIGNAVLETSPGEVVLPTKMFKKLDGVVMGHVHPHMIVRKKKPFMTYIGSMECKDFGEAKHNKYFLVIDNNKGKLKFNFEPLPIRPLHDIIIDQSDVISSKEVIEGSKEYLKEFAETNILDGSIVRVTIIMNERALYGFNKDKIRYFLKKDLKVNRCVGIYPQMVSKRQLRKSSITERNDPLVSFNEFLELELDLSMREKMKKVGTRIIKERGKNDSS